jgi:DNA-binding SARP family transcriptional activator/TolB-like protein
VYGRSVEAGVVGSVGTLEIRVLGPISVRRDGVALALPPSRKVRALLAYLVLTPHAVRRESLCELLWDVPNDPRAELRWCLSRLRSFLDDTECNRVQTEGDAIRIDVATCFVDGVLVLEALPHLHAIAAEELRALEALFVGDVLEGIDVPDSPAFASWLTGQRRRFRNAHISLLERLANDATDTATNYLEKWVAAAPFDVRAHTGLLRRFASHHQLRDGEEHVAATIERFRAEGIDGTALREAWQNAKAKHGTLLDLQPADFDLSPATHQRASIAVMPFADDLRLAGTPGKIADALAYDVTSRLAKLRSLFVIAQGSAFALRDRGLGANEAARVLNVNYVASGSVRRQAGASVITAELVEVRTARIVWTETFHASDAEGDDAFAALEKIGDSIVAAIAGEIETAERNRAILRPPNSLNAWEAYHCGLWHMYRFNNADNERARQFFEMALALDRTFSRAYAGLSFTHFQNAFQGWTKRVPGVERAFESAAQSIMADDRDPSAHWAMGRALWLRGDFDPSVLELEQAIGLSPNFALGHYTLAFVHSQLGNPEAAIASSDTSQRLSPYDPLLFGMFGARAMALVRVRRFEEAAAWGVKAASRPNAHEHILAIAAISLGLAGRTDEARSQLQSIRKTIPHYTVGDFLAAFKFSPEDETVFRSGAKSIGLS